MVPATAGAAATEGDRRRQLQLWQQEARQPAWQGGAEGDAHSAGSSSSSQASQPSSSGDSASANERAASRPSAGIKPPLSARTPLPARAAASSQHALPQQQPVWSPAKKAAPQPCSARGAGPSRLQPQAPPPKAQPQTADSGAADPSPLYSPRKLPASIAGAAAVPRLKLPGLGSRPGSRPSSTRGPAAGLAKTELDRRRLQQQLDWQHHLVHRYVNCMLESFLLGKRAEVCCAA